MEKKYKVLKIKKAAFENIKKRQNNKNGLNSVI